MTTPVSVGFLLPDGWTLRKVTAAMTREWLPPFLAKTAPKAPRWLLQPIVEMPEKANLPLWEPGIATDAYEDRLEHADISWAIRANMPRRRGLGTILARFRMNRGPRVTMEMTVPGTPLPESLFDRATVDEHLQAGSAEGIEGLLVSLLSREGFQPVPR